MHPVRTSPLRPPPVGVMLLVQLAVAVGVGLGNPVGLQPRLVAAGHGVNTGALVSTERKCVGEEKSEELDGCGIIKKMLLVRMHPVPTSPLRPPPVGVMLLVQLSVAV